MADGVMMSILNYNKLNEQFSSILQISMISEMMDGIGDQPSTFKESKSHSCYSKTDSQLSCN